jgi:hypothetical protein
LNALLSAVATQTGAEVRMRLRSPATFVACLAIAAGTFFWLPSSHGKAVSMSWETASGVLVAPLYTSGAVAVALAIFSGIFLLLVGYYLVAGSVRRDRERGVGLILAATPLSNEGYLLGKFASNFAYLGVLSLLVLSVGLVRFAIEGVGRFDPISFFLPFVLIAGPSLAFTAAAAVFFDVAPLLRSRAGNVAWFFAFIFVVAAASVSRHTENGRLISKSIPVFDPSGTATIEQLVVESIPDAKNHSVSTGHIVLDRAPVRVPWKGIRISAGVVAARVLNFLWAVPPLFGALLLFDRFDPARRKFSARRRRSKAPETSTALAAGAEVHALSISPAEPRPGFARSAAAEALLLWQSGPIAKWLLLAASLASLFVPATALTGVAAGWIVLLVPVIAEAAAREDLAGTRSLVFSQPGIPRSAVLWKTASMALFLLVLGAPFAVRFSTLSAARGLAWITGLLFVASFASGAGSLTRGGKLFSGILLVLWYIALSGARDFDFCGITGGATGVGMRAVYLGIGAAFVAAAAIVERRAAGRGM